MATLKVNNILCFISTARHTKTDKQILKYCLSFYEINEIREAETLLFNYGKERSVRRRSDNSGKSEIMDILDQFRTLEETHVAIPTFVADSFDAMPPTAENKSTNPLLSSLVDEIKILKDEIMSIKDISTTSEILLENYIHLKSDILDIKDNLRDLKLKFIMIK